MRYSHTHLRHLMSAASIALLLTYAPRAHAQAAA
jgi:hypothetical protein